MKRDLLLVDCRVDNIWGLFTYYTLGGGSGARNAPRLGQNRKKKCPISAAFLQTRAWSML
ncbi:MAG: hypothetical protein GX417_03225 [Clostridiales bacterium]|nr:hypothetical protein [Clostridiales bacterium]